MTPNGPWRATGLLHLRIGAALGRIWRGGRDLTGGLVDLVLAPTQMRYAGPLTEFCGPHCGWYLDQMERPQLGHCKGTSCHGRDPVCVALEPVGPDGSDPIQDCSHLPPCANLSPSQVRAVRRAYERGQTQGDW